MFACYLAPSRRTGPNHDEGNDEGCGEVRAERDRERCRRGVQLLKSAERCKEEQEQSRGEDREWERRPEDREWPRATPAPRWCVNGALQCGCTAQSDQSKAESEKADSKCHLTRPCDRSEEE